VDLLTIIVCSVDIGGLADHHCLFLSTEQKMMVSKSTNINRTNNDG
jgi:hypothetical protein